MWNRRDVVRCATALFALACGRSGWGGPHVAFTSGRKDGVNLPEARWKELLSANEHEVLRGAGTERAFSGDLWDHHADGVYICAGCALPLFDSRTKFDSGTGWPSYYRPYDKDAVAERSDRTLGMLRTEVLCNRCGGHLGHVFPDGPEPTGLRYCINSAALDFLARSEAAALPTPAPVRLGGADGVSP
jgi:peptide-methionine (R)-S-oxide reductase